MFKTISSLSKKLVIESQRAIDHTWRKIFGFPTLRRSMITPQIFLGGQYGIKKIQTMKKLGITAVVNMRTTPFPYEKLLHPMQYLSLPTPDNQAPTLENLQMGSKFIDDVIQKKGKVYIHCREGEGRGPTMAIAYLIYKGLSYEDAFDTVQKVRTFIAPTAVQINQLKKFEDIMNKIEAAAKK